MWMAVKQRIIGSQQPPVDNILNIDTIVRIGPNSLGCYIKFLDGSEISVADGFQEIAAVLLQAQGK
jgi:hypothetical protein